MVRILLKCQEVHVIFIKVLILVFSSLFLEAIVLAYDFFLAIRSDYHNDKLLFQVLFKLVHHLDESQLN